MSKKNIYKSIDSSGYENYIEIESDQHNIKGTYYGICKNSKGMIFYYKADLMDLYVKKDEIKFVTTNLQYSKNPISPYSKEIQFFTPETFACVGRDHFYGKIQGDTIIFERMKAFSNSRFDQMEFSKIE